MNLSDIIHMEIEVEEESSLVGFCVLGGIFSEGIDLKEDSLIGALIVGTGLPQVCTEREIIRGYFEENGENGLTMPTGTLAEQSASGAGRVIRTADDVRNRGAFGRPVPDAGLPQAVSTGVGAV